jgi:hypothetical protein
MTDHENTPTEPTEPTEPSAEATEPTEAIETNETTETTETADATPRRRRPLLVGIAAGVLGLAVGAGGALGATAIFGPDGHGPGRMDHSHDGGRHGDMHGDMHGEMHGDGAYGDNQ